MDFVKWIVENPLLDVLVNNNQNEDVPWRNAYHVVTVVVSRNREVDGLIVG